MSATPNLSIRGARVIDPASGIDTVTDIHLASGRVLALGDPPADFSPGLTLNADGLVACPGLIDLAVHLREPGEEHKATIASETKAAARSGITTLVCTPDTDPVIDTPAVWELIRRRAKTVGRCRVLAVGALTRGLDGLELAEMAALQRAGCVAVGNAERPLGHTGIARLALEYAATFDLLVMLRPEDQALAAGGCVHEGMVATRLGLPGIPSAAETVAVARDLALAQHCGARIHFNRLSAAEAIRMVTAARTDGTRVTADVAIHQLHLTEQDIDGFNAEAHVSPPLRTLADRDALRRAVARGEIQVICSDHQPHEPDAKARPLPETLPGISGLETLLPLGLRLVEEGVFGLPDLIERLTWGPARILGLDLGRIQPGSIADLCIFDPDAHWQLEPHSMSSAGRNTPFSGWEFRGRVTHTIYEGRLVYGDL
jgi:dihydroorotase